MYFHLGHDTVVNGKEIIGIFDLDTATVSKRTRNYLSDNEKKGKIKLVSAEIPLSFVVCQKNKDDFKIYFSPVSSLTLQKRSEEKMK